MRKFMALAAVLALAATPALAGLTPDSYSPIAMGAGGSGGHTVGIWGGTSTAVPTANVVRSHLNSDIDTVTFAVHWPSWPNSPSINTMFATQVLFSLGWDTNEVSMVSLNEVNLGTFPAFSVGNGWGGWSESATGIGDARFGLLSPAIAGTSSDSYGFTFPLRSQGFSWASGSQVGSTMFVSQVIPIFQFQYHVHNRADDGLADIWVNSAAMQFNLISTGGASGPWWTGGGIGAVSYGLEVVPEPASLSLLGLGIAATGLGVWRRRR